MSYDKMLEEIASLVDIEFSELSSVLGISVATHGGKNIFTRFRDNFTLSENQIAAASTSLLFLASNMFERMLNHNVSHTITKGENHILLCLISSSITGSVVLDRKLVELGGLQEYKEKMKELFLKISAIVETSPSLKEDLFTQIKRAIPNALSIAIINKEGLPIKIQSTMEGPKLSAFIYALHQLTNVIMDQKSEYTIISGDYGSIIIEQIDSERIIGIAVPESNESKLGKYMVTLENIIREI